MLKMKSDFHALTLTTCQIAKVGIVGDSQVGNSIVNGYGIGNSNATQFMCINFIV